MDEEKYKSALDKLKVRENFNDRTLAFLMEKSGEKQEADSLTFNHRRKYKKKYAVPMAAVILFGIVIGTFLINISSTIELPNSTGNVKVQYVKNTPDVRIQNDLVQLTEDELFHKYNTSIFKGEVKDIQNIKIDFGSGNKHYQAIASIKVDEVYRGNEKTGDIVRVLLPCPVNSDIWVEDTGVVSQVRVGTVGIFMPKKYDDNDYWEESGSRLILKDISGYGFMDGERFAFLQTKNGIIYADWAYPSVSEVSTLDELKGYVLKMIERGK